MQITLAQLLAVMPNSKFKNRAQTFLPGINATLLEFDISTPKRVAAFLAQVGHESGQLVYVKELASGTAYEGRKDLGNTSPGDGVKYKGRGLIQITGKTNYTALMMALNVDCLAHPEVIEEPTNAARSAGWFWKTHGCNALADSGDFVALTKRINGGTNGLADRQALYAVAKKVFGVS